MNNQRDLIKRLLRLFPVKTLKEYFAESGHASDVIEVVSAKPVATVRTFVKNNYLNTKQHVHFYSIRRQISPNVLRDFPFEISLHEDRGNNSHLIVCLVTTTYKVILSNPLESVELKFLHPIVIDVSNSILKIHFTKLEKNVAPYFEEDRSAIRSGQTNTEQEIHTALLSYLDRELGISIIDINKGIKELWESDYIDCSKVQWRKDSSVAMETMDEDLLFKERYPEEYEDIVSKPLVKTYFKYIREDDYFCDNFDADPGTGQINIPKFPKTPNQVRNVINEILTLN